jgi:carbamoyltransferase
MAAILGISAFYHDSAAALVVDGQIVAAAQEERFSRKKHDPGFPQQAIDYCLAEAGLAPDQLDYVGFYDKPFLKFERLLETYLAFAPAGFASFVRAMPLWLKQKLFMRRELSHAMRGRYKRRFVFTEHHESHAASAFFPSPFDEAAIVTLDGVGEWATSTIGHGRDNRIEMKRELRFPHSLGLLYSAFTYYTGFEVNSGEYKLMGLAPYGEPRYVDLILENLLDLKPDGSFRLDLSYFNYCQGLTMTGRKFDRLFGAPPRRRDEPVRDLDMDVAASAQKVTEMVMLRCAEHAHALTGSKHLCLAGGVALNCVGNGRLLREGPFDQIWIQPAAGDAGGALGTALFIWHQLLGRPRQPDPNDSMRGSLLGPAYNDQQIAGFVESVGCRYERFEDDEACLDHVAEQIADGKVVGWFDGRMEFGPRALGSRSIIGDARSPAMQRIINMKVKFREGFRPFAPAVLNEHVGEYFDLGGKQDSPYMLLVGPVNEKQRKPVDPGLADARGIDKLKQVRSQVPAITHVDYSARVQSVDPSRHGRYRKLIEKFHRKTACPVVVNTSFNLGWEPIVCTPADAYRTFMSCDLDLLVLGRHVIRKVDQPVTVSHGPADDVAGEKGAPALAGQKGDWLDELLVSPCHHARLRSEPAQRVCTECGQVFPIDQGIARMYHPHEKIDDPRDVTEQVKAFYEQTPFPNYNDHDSLRSLIDKARSGRYAKTLDETIRYNTSVLEVGCGTGQLSNFLGISHRRVVGADLCLNSLRLGEAFRAEHGLDRVRFVQMNLFRPCFADHRFDVVLCNGVLHHTADPRGGFEGLVRLVKPGGHIVVGLYNRYGRLATDARRHLFRLTGGRMKWIDPILRHTGLSEGRRKAWFADQYRHPHESKHTIDEVLNWFDAMGVEFVRGVPGVLPDGPAFAAGDLFSPQPRGSRLDHALVQAKEIIAGNREGGFFLMIGRKPGNTVWPAAKNGTDQASDEPVMTIEADSAGRVAETSTR